MNNKKINGVVVSEILYEELRNYLLRCDKVPTIVDISIGNELGAVMYSKVKKVTLSKETGINFKSIHFDKISYLELINYIRKLNNDGSVNGIMIQLPLPSDLRNYEREILEEIDPKKDIDGLTSFSSGLLSVGEDCFVPCTALGIETLLKAYDISLVGKKVAVINRSNIVGKPLIQLLLRNDATVVICNSKTSNLSDITRECDIVIVALNKMEYITSDYIKEGAIVIDVGVHRNEFGNVVGDVWYDDVYNKASLVTPPVGAVGPMTVCMLAYNTVKSVYGNEVNQVLENGIIKAREVVIKK